MRYVLPFLYDTATGKTILNSFNNLKLDTLLFSDIANSQVDARKKWYIHRRKKLEYFNILKHGGETLANELTKQIPNLNEPEVYNNISIGLNPKANHLKVFLINSKRGKHWLHLSELLKPYDPDVIILNDMDLGMARTGQQHTTRLLAHAIGMNYVFGVEFVELTRGSKEERMQTKGMRNDLGLSGNAILSKFPY